MDRNTVSTGVLLASLLMAMPALAQDRHQWTTDRPDGHAPTGVKSDFLLPMGELYVGYRYSSQKFRGTLVGTEQITPDQVLDFFTVAPLTQDQSTGELDLRYGVTESATVAVSVPWTRNKMLNTTDLIFYQTSSEFIGDVSVQGLVNLLEMHEFRLTATLGGTVPTGSIGERGIVSTGVVGVLPFPMQGGSGTWDVLSGVTFQVQNEVASVGAQVNSVVRVHDNRRGYRLGDELGFSMWGAYTVSDWASFSMRALFEHWGEITGSELRTDGAADPLANPFAQGGERVVIPFGINFFLRQGKAAGHRLSLEYYYPVHEDLNGPQMSADRAFVVSWQSVF
jgi:hypothetical protein